MTSHRATSGIGLVVVDCGSFLKLVLNQQTTAMMTTVSENIKYKTSRGQPSADNNDALASEERPIEASPSQND